MTERLPVFVLTGFLGSGKTTLLQRYLRSGAGAGTGIVVNEWGAEAVDHRLLVHADEQVELLDGGCLCCARRADIARAVGALVRQDRSGFQRLVIETSGLADPAPIVATLARDAWLRAHTRLDGVVTVVDAVAGLGNLANHAEARRQVAIADMVVVTKTDLRAAGSLPALGRAVREIAPDVTVLDSGEPEFSPTSLFSGRSERVRSSFAAESAVHSEGVSSFALDMPEHVDWPCFTLWLSALLHAHGDRILRVKGILRASGSPRPLVIHGVQHVMHPPTHLAVDDGRPGGLVFITSGLRRDAVAQSLDAFLRMSVHTPARSSAAPTRSTAASA